MRTRYALHKPTLQVGKVASGRLETGVSATDERSGLQSPDGSASRRTVARDDAVAVETRPRPLLPASSRGRLHAGGHRPRPAGCGGPVGRGARAAAGPGLDDLR